MDGGEVISGGLWQVHTAYDGPGFAVYNDNFADATVISGAAGSQTGSTLNDSGHGGRIFTPRSRA
jgi:hypothetical protein